MSTSKAPPPDNSLRTIAAEHRRHLVAARAIESDLDFAFRLQLEEAINASLSLQPSSSSSTPKPKLPLPDSPNDDVLKLAGMKLDKFEQELNDRALIEAEMKKTREDLDRRIHDQRVAREIQSIPDDEWEEEGEYFERPFGEGSSKNVATEVFRVYFKGLVNEDLVSSFSSNATVAGIGVAICDSRDQLIFELKKPLIGSEMSRRAVECKALIEGLNAAVALDLKRIVYYCDYFPLYQFVTGRWRLPKQRKLATLITQVSRLQIKFTYCRPTLVARNDIKFAFKFAREAITSQINKASSSSSSNQIKKENCVICFEDTDITHIFSVDVCNHRYCFSCMRQHVEMKLRIGMLPKCPHEGCNLELKLDSCQKFLTQKLIELMGQRLKEASIPPTEKIYCPYPKCSNLMTKKEVLEYSKTSVDWAPGWRLGAWRLGARKCLNCKMYFCINCKVPWHNSMSCNEYKRKMPNPGDAKLKTLAESNMWRQCVKCNHMIELVAGCYHMTCRCGYEFCYTCGAEWKNKKATCACPLWDEQNILDDNEDDEDDDDDEFDDEVSYESYYDSDSDDY